MSRKRAARHRRHDGGQALVEFSLVLTVFALLLFGVFDMGRIVYVYTATSEAAREAARWGSVQFRSQTSASRSSVASRAIGSLTAVPSPSATATCSRDGTAVTDPDTCHAGDLLTVQVTSRVSPITPIIGQLVPEITVTSTAAVTVQQ